MQSTGSNSSGSSKKKKVGDYIIHLGKVLGQGTFSKVYFGYRANGLIEDKSDQLFKKQPMENKFAIKEISNSTLMRLMGPMG